MCQCVPRQSRGDCHFVLWFGSRRFINTPVDLTSSGLPQLISYKSSLAYVTVSPNLSLLDQNTRFLLTTVYFQLTRWTNMSPLSVPRCHANLVVANDQLFLIGGRSRHMEVPSLGSIHVYCEQSDTWDHVADMRIPRHDFGCVVISRCFTREYETIAFCLQRVIAM